MAEDAAAQAAFARQARQNALSPMDVSGAARAFAEAAEQLLSPVGAREEVREPWKACPFLARPEKKLRALPALKNISARCKPSFHSSDAEGFGGAGVELAGRASARRGSVVRALLCAL